MTKRAKGWDDLLNGSCPLAKQGFYPFQFEMSMNSSTGVTTVDANPVRHSGMSFNLERQFTVGLDWDSSAFGLN